MLIENRPFNRLAVGDLAEFRRLCTEEDLWIFAAATGNHNPMHLPDADVNGDGEPEAIASGLFVASLISAVLGNVLPGPGTLYRSQNLVFHSHARAGETLVARVRVVEKMADGGVRLSTEVRLDKGGALIVSGEAVVTAPTVPRSFDDTGLPGLRVEAHRHFDALLKRAEPLPALPCAVVCPETADALQGAMLAARHSLILPIFVGRPDRIRRAAEAAGEDLTGIEIVAAEGEDEDIARAAVALVRAGRAGSLMKGHLHTECLMRPILDRAGGLRRGERRMSHVFVMDVPGLAHPLLVTDAAINIAPDLTAKVDITQNAIDLARALGIETPRVGVLSAVETVTPAIRSSVDAALLSKMAERGQITGGLVEGPLALDNAVDLRAARMKGLRSRVAGRAEVLVVPGIDAGNILAKELSFLSGAEAAGIVMGARVPVILTSRADSAKARLASAAIAALLANPSG